MNRAVWALAGIVLLGALGGWWYVSRHPASPAPHAEVSAYIDAATCAGCHQAIYRTYVQTGMGRSFFRPRQDRTIEDFSGNNSFYHRASDRYYTMTSRGGALYQRRHQLGPRGEEINVFEKRVDYVLGSGNHSRTYLYQGAGGRLYEMPLAWYAGPPPSARSKSRGDSPAERGYWHMNPGYDRPDHKGFRREIAWDCLFCHNGYPPAPESIEATPGSNPVWPETLAEGIDCQRCHGPGRAHIEAAGARQPVEAVRAAIFNPKRAGRDRQLEVCMQCHLESTSRPLPYSLVRYERGVFSYRIGQPLPDYILHFDHAAGTGNGDKFEIAHAAYRLRKSACFNRSAMTCTTCHDPHRARRGAEAIAHYKSVCQGCHRSAHNAERNCMNCHMPKRRTDDVVHVVMTDHFIQRRRPARDLLAPIAEKHETELTAYRGEVVPYYPKQIDELYLAVAQVSEGSNLKGGIPRLEAALAKYKPQPAQFYFDLAEAYWKNNEPAKAVPYYEAALLRQPSHSAAIRNCAVALRRLGELDKAAGLLERAPEDPAALATLGDVYLSLDRTADAERVLRKAVSLDPDSPEALNNLGQALARLGDRSGSVAALRNALIVRPGYAVAHNNLANQLEEGGDGEGAIYHFEQALRHDQHYAEAHYNYGTALAKHGRFKEAEEQLLAAVRLEPKLADAHNNLGNLYAAQGRHAQAVASFRNALAAQPALGTARLNLAVALASSGRNAEAIEELKKAAQNSDPQVREAALRGLEELGAR
ncbi:MAG: tetratricopeptide repeat protein [Acidobacteria bacterium]|nr:tetratricopeptide repeat protein [Acidobacteriota bacterium]